MSRAGLVSLVLLFLSISLVVSAPVPERVLSLAQRSDDYDHDTVARSLATLIDREFDISDADYTAREYEHLFDREFDMEDDDYIFKRELSTLDPREFDNFEQEYTKREDSDVHTLYRRRGGRGVASKTRAASHKVAAKPKSGFKQVSPSIKNIAAKVASAVATVAVASDKIHANIGKLSKFTNGLNHAINPIGSAGKAAAKHGGKAGKIISSLLF